MRVICDDELILCHSTRYFEPETFVSVDIAPENIQVMKPSDYTKDIVKSKRQQLMNWED